MKELNDGKNLMKIKNVTLGNDQPLIVIAGPCQLESREHALMMAQSLKADCDKLGIGFIYKTSFDKANRTSGSARRGIGLYSALPIFKEIQDMSIPVLTDVHEINQCAIVAPFVDVLQIPAFLCRQTDLIVAAAKTGLPVNVKKGQFLAPWDIVNIHDKIISTPMNGGSIFTERGSCFGYNSLVVDMKSMQIMADDTKSPIIFDATHSVQIPGGQGTSSGGQRQFVPTLAKAAVATGIAGVFIEVHEDPGNAPSDGPNMIDLRDFSSLVSKLMSIDRIVKA